MPPARRAARVLVPELLEERVPPSVSPVTDISSPTGDAFPSAVVSVGAREYFTAYDGIARQLYETDGTTAGTVLLNPLGALSNPDRLTAVGDRLYFLSKNDSELWTTDGTATTRVASGLQKPDQLTAVGNQLYFTTLSSSGTAGLWVVKATSATELLTDTLTLSQLSAGGNLLYFNDGARLWETDGTTVQRLMNVDTPVSSITAAGAGNTIFFVGSDISNGPELWTSDGTPRGTVLVKDINPGMGGSYPQSLTEVNGTLFFTATDGSGPTSLWETDGTAAHTQPVPGPGGNGSLLNLSSLQPFTDATGKTSLLLIGTTSAGSSPSLYITDGTTTLELTASAEWPITSTVGRAYFDSAGQLWETDGTPAGTGPVPGAAGISPGAPTALTAAGARVYFRVIGVNPNPADVTYALYVTDGVSTTYLHTFDGGSLGGLNPALNNLTAVGSTLFFSARDDHTGWQLWTSDGTPAGTVLVKDINTVPTASPPSAVVEAAGLRFFAANDASGNPVLWETDGTGANTQPVPGPGGVGSLPNPAALRPFTDAQGKRWLLLDSGASSLVYEPSSLYETDGVTTVLLASPTSATEAMSAGGYAYFYLYKDFYPWTGALWETDGTSAGTRPVAGPSGTSLSPTATTIAVAVPEQGRLYFASGAGDATTLYMTDGTTTTLLHTFNAGSQAVDNLTDSGGTLFFRASDSLDGTELWTSDGTAAGTRLVDDVNTVPVGSDPGPVVDTGSKRFFAASDAQGQSLLWQTDGTLAHTQLVPGPGGTGNLPNPTPLQPFTDAQGKTWLLLSSPASPGATPGLYVTDGTTTRALTGAQAGPLGPTDVTISGPRAFFYSSANSNALWETDGTSAGTMPVPGAPSPLSSDRPMPAPGGLVYFTSAGASSSTQLNVTDGVTTTPLAIFTSDVYKLTALNGRVFFDATDSAHGAELWTSDGTPAGTQLVADLNPGAGSSYPSRVVALGGQVYFTADDGQHGGQLYRIDGTTTTVIGAADSPTSLNDNAFAPYAVGSRLYFTSNNHSALWTTDGSTSTELVSGLGTYAINGVTVVGDHVYFTTDLGQQLWEADPAGAVKLSDGLKSPLQAVVNGSLLYFLAPDAAGTTGVWVADGRTLTEVAAGLSGPDKLTVSGNFTYFVNYSINVPPTLLDSGPAQLYAAAGTTATLLQTFDPHPGGGTALASLVVNNLVATSDGLYFTAAAATTGPELWKTDGTPGSVALLSQINTATQSSDPSPPVAVGRTFYFTANDGPDGVQLYQTDGTTTRAVLPTDGNPLTGPDTLTVVGSRLYFLDSLQQLWTTDGSSTLRLGGFSAPGALTASGGALYFIATDSAGARGLWVAQGSSVTELGGNFSNVQALVPTSSGVAFAATDANGPGLWESDGATLHLLGRFATLQNLAATSAGLYFSADDGLTGWQLWKSDGDPSTPSPPDTAGQYVTIEENVPQSITLQAADQNAGASLASAIVAAPQHGSLTGAGLAVVYTPAADFTGTDSFTYTVNDGAATSNVASVSIAVVPSAVGAGQPPNTATLVTSTPLTQQLTVTAPVGTILSAAAVPDPSPADAPTTVHFPEGFLTFAMRALAPGAAATLTLTLPAGVQVTDYYQYGPTPDNPANHWYEFRYDGQTGAEFVMPASGPEQIILHYVDGQRGDSDLTANGQIVDPGAPAATGMPVPTIAVAVSSGSYTGQPVAATATVADESGTRGATLEGVGLTLDYQQLDRQGNVSAELGSQAPSTPGSYRVTATFAGSHRYTSASQSAAFHIDPAPLTVNVASIAKTFGQDDSAALAGTVLGIQNNEPIHVSYHSAGAVVSAGVAGSPYAITVRLDDGGSGALANYAVTINAGALTINPAVPTLALSAGGGTYNGQPFAASLQVTGLSGTAAGSLEGIGPTLDYVHANPDGTTTDLGSQAPASAGTYQVTATFAGSANYQSMVSAPQAFTIAAAQPTLTLSVTGGTYTGSAFPATAQVAGLSGTAQDTLEGVRPTLTYYSGTSASGMPLPGAPSAAGTYTVLASFAGSTNYSAASITRTYTIAPEQSSSPTTTPPGSPTSGSTLSTSPEPSGTTRSTRIPIPSTLRLSVSRVLKGSSGVVHFASHTIALGETNARARLQVRLHTNVGRFVLPAAARSMHGNHTRTLSLTGTVATIQHTLGRLTLQLGKGHHHAQVTVLASDGGTPQQASIRVTV